MARILLIEDDIDVRWVMQHVLLDAQHRVDTSSTLDGGLALLASRHYDLVVTDGRLPDGTGIALADKAEEKGVAALIVTGYAFGLRNDEPGADLAKYNLLLKPVRPDELVNAVARALAASRARIG